MQHLKLIKPPVKGLIFEIGKRTWQVESWNKVGEGMYDMTCFAPFTVKRYERKFSASVGEI